MASGASGGKQNNPNVTGSSPGGGNAAADAAVVNAAQAQAADQRNSSADGQIADIVVTADPHMHDMYRDMSNSQWNWYYDQSGLRNDHGMAHMALSRTDPALATPNATQLSARDQRWVDAIRSDQARSLGDRPIEDGGFVANVLFDTIATAGVGAVWRTGEAVVARTGTAMLNRSIAAETAVVTKPGTALQTYWPPNRGFQGASITEELTVGARIDRYGYEGGTFLSPQGTPDWMRSLAPVTTPKPYNICEVTSPLQVQSGKAAPWFGQVGQSTQYELPMSVSDAIAKGYLKRVGP